MHAERPHRGEIVIDFVDDVALRNVHQQLAETPPIRVERSEAERRSTEFSEADMDAALDRLPEAPAIA
jgi:hypothetical protein